MTLTTAARWFFAVGTAAAAFALLAWRVQPPWLSPHELGVATGVAAGAFTAGLVTAWTGDFADTAPAALRRRYYRAIALPMVALVMLMLSWERLLDHVQTPGLRAAVALLPVLPVALLLHIAIRHVLDLDDLQRRIETESVAFASALVGLGYLAMAFLQQAAVIDLSAEQAMQWLVPLVCGAYLVARLLIQRRYR